MLEQVRKVFSGDVVAVDDVSLEVADGEFLVRVGPSGCGNSTLLRMIARFEDVTGGSISIDDRVVTDLPPRARDIVVGIRPEAFEDAALADPSLPQVEVTVEVVEDLGPDTHIDLATGLRLERAGAPEPAPA